MKLNTAFTNTQWISMANSRASHLTRKATPTVFRRSVFSLLLASLVMVAAAPETAYAHLRYHTVWGTWYLALDAGPFIPGVENGLLFLSGLATFHRDGTTLLTDAGDLGDMAFGTKHTPQQGVWIRKGRNRIKATLLSIEADVDGVVKRWLKVQMILRLSKNGMYFNGTASVSQLACDLPVPVSPLACPDPIANADAFVPDVLPDGSDAVDLPIQLTRLRPE